MVKNKFKPVIDESLCKNCQLCQSFCPKDVFDFNKDRDQVEVAQSEECIGCKICEKMCPDLAIQVQELKNPERGKNS